MCNMSIRIDLNDAIFALSDSLDLVGIDEVAHGKRVGYMAFKCAEVMGVDKRERERLFQIGLVHDIGVSSTQVHHHLVTEMQWAHDEDHAITGEKLINQSRHLTGFATAIRYHHTPWSFLQPMRGLSQQDKNDANLIFLVDRVDALSAAHYNVDLQLEVDNIRQRIQAMAGDLFSPELVEIFLHASESDSFWLMLEPPHLDRFMIDMRAMTLPFYIDNDDVKDIARIFAQVVDAKSKFTFEHSIGVAALSRFLASELGFDADSLIKIEIAGLLHDLGKLRIPDEILDKPDRLDRQDTLIMHRHSFETYQVLREIRGFEDIALWASYHHERPDGSGYPFKRSASDLGQEARIIAVADIFQALAQERPYRGAMSITEICAVLAQMAEHNLLDQQIVEFAIKHAQQCHEQASGLVQTREIA